MNNQNKRLTFGLIIDQISSFGDNENFQSMIISGVADYARRHDIDLICFVAGKIFSPLDWERSRTILLEFVQSRHIDGLIVLSTAIGSYVDKQSVLEILDQYSGLKIVTIGEPFDHHYSVFASGYDGMREAIEHLVDAHHCRRIGFLRGPVGRTESEARFQAYQDVLLARGIPYDPELVRPGDFLYEAGAKAIEYWLNNGTQYDAIVASNDNMALGAITQLRNRFGSIPVDLPIVGFDDAAYSKQLGLTTVRQNFHKVAGTAAEVLHKALLGEPVDKDHEIRTELVLRSSCGCMPPAVYSAGQAVYAGDRNPVSQIEPLRTLIMNELDSKQTNKELELKVQMEDTIHQFMVDVVDAFLEDLFRNEVNRFYHAWSRLIFWLIEKEGSLFYLNDILTTIRKAALNHLAVPERIVASGNLFHSARVLIGEAIGRTAASSYYSSSLQTADLDRFSEDLFVDLDIEKQMKLMEGSISKYGVSSGFVALYDDPDHPMLTARLIMAYIGEERLDTGKDGIRFPTRDVLPSDVMSRLKQQRTNLVVVALHHGDSKLGYAIFSFEDKINRAYEVIRQRLSIALKGAVLMADAKNHAVYLEQQVNERTREISETNLKLLVEIEKRQEAEMQLRQALDHLAELNEDLRALSIRDELTGLLNRRGFMERGGLMLQDARNNGHSVLVMFADMDKLKSINDLYGHDEGDRAISLVGDILRASLPVSSVIARMGGDEFTAIIPLTDSVNAEALLRAKITGGFHDYTKQSRLAYTMSISMGFALYEFGSSLSFNELIKLADDGLYVEKRKKRKTYKDAR